MEVFKFEQLKQCDIGGLGCNCCNKWKGKNRKKVNRVARRKIKLKDKKYIK